MVQSRNCPWKGTKLSLPFPYKQVKVVWIVHQIKTETPVPDRDKEDIYSVLRHMDFKTKKGEILSDFFKNLFYKCK